MALSTMAVICCAREGSDSARIHASSTFCSIAYSLALRSTALRSARMKPEFLRGGSMLLVAGANGGTLTEEPLARGPTDAGAGGNELLISGTFTVTSRVIQRAHTE